MPRLRQILKMFLLKIERTSHFELLRLSFLSLYLKKMWIPANFFTLILIFLASMDEALNSKSWNDDDAEDNDKDGLRIWTSQTLTFLQFMENKDQLLSNQSISCFFGFSSNTEICLLKRAVLGPEYLI